VRGFKESMKEDIMFWGKVKSQRWPKWSRRSCICSRTIWGW